MVLEIRYPLEPRPRVAVLRTPADVLPAHLPDAIAAPAWLLLKLHVPGWQPTFPIVAFTGPAHGFLSEQDRDAIWRRWGVPVYEQLALPSFEVVAEECDAHMGLHLLRPDWRSAGIRAELITSACPCGSSAPRLSGIAPLATAACA